MAHIAMQQNNETGSPVTWGEHATDDQYATEPMQLSSERLLHPVR